MRREFEPPRPPRAPRAPRAPRREEKLVHEWTRIFTNKRKELFVFIRVHSWIKTPGELGGSNFLGRELM
jgi:hypothetical protein